MCKYFPTWFRSRHTLVIFLLCHRHLWEHWELRILLLRIVAVLQKLNLCGIFFFSDCSVRLLLLQFNAVVVFRPVMSLERSEWWGVSGWVGAGSKIKITCWLQWSFFFAAAKQRLLVEEGSMAKITALRTKPFTWPWGDAIRAYQDSSGNVTKPVCV